MIIRAEYLSGPEIRYLSNLDMLSVFHRALRRARLPYALSQGFNPHIKMTLGVALPVGLWSEREYFDLEMSEDISVQDFIETLNRNCPPGMLIKEARIVQDRNVSLMVLINACSYRFIYERLHPSAEEIARSIMNSEQWMIDSRGKKKNQQKDLRSGIIRLESSDSEQNSIFNIWAAANEPLNIRYDELIDLLNQAGADKVKMIDAYKTGNYHYSDEKMIRPLDMEQD